LDEDVCVIVPELVSQGCSLCLEELSYCTLVLVHGSKADRGLVWDPSLYYSCRCHGGKGSASSCLQQRQSLSSYGKLPNQCPFKVNGLAVPRRSDTGGRFGITSDAMGCVIAHVGSSAVFKICDACVGCTALSCGRDKQANLDTTAVKVLPHPVH